MKIGKLRHRIELQSKVVTRDELGGQTISWAVEATVPAAVEPLTGREFFAAQQVQSEVEVRFRIRYFRRMRPEWRVVWEGSPYNVLAILDLEGRRREQHLMAKSVKE